MPFRPDGRVLARALALSGLLLAAGVAPARGQQPIRYEIAFANAAHHEARVEVVFPDVDPGLLDVRMSRTSPGRYALHEFAKNVYDVDVTGVDGRSVRVSRPDLHTWRVAEHGGEVRVAYTLYGDFADGTYTAIDRTHAHLNMPATFLWAEGLEARPIELSVRVPEGSGWRVATQLVPTDDPHRFTAPDMAYFMDSPTEVSDFWMRAWEVDGPGGPQTVRVALHHLGSEAEAEEYARKAAAIVEAERRIFGHLPRFDHGTYTFLACYLPWADGDGMEHRNSTVLTSASSLASNMNGVLGTVAHEFFHSWSIERIRPETLEPFDFEAANVSRELWFGEGFTSYVDDLSLWRAGVIDDDDFAGRMGGIANAVTNARGRAHYSAIEMSMQAPFVDAAVSVDPQNKANTFLSYYTWGSGIGLALDLTLRARPGGRSLDHLFREMWRAHGDPEIPYSAEDVEVALARTTGDEAFARDFFDRYVRGHEAPDYAALFATAGLELVRADASVGALGPASLRFEADGAVVTEATLERTPLYDAGIDRGDRIVSVDGRPVTGRADLERALAGRAPGAQVEIVYESRGARRTTTVALARDEALGARWVPAPSTPQRATRTTWKEGIR